MTTPASASASAAPAAPGSATASPAATGPSSAAPPAPAAEGPGVAPGSAKFDWRKAIDTHFQLPEAPQLDMTKEALTPADFADYQRRMGMHKSYSEMREQLHGLLDGGYEYELGGEKVKVPFSAEDAAALEATARRLKSSPILSAQDIVLLTYGPRLARLAYERGVSKGTATPPAKIPAGTVVDAPDAQPTKIDVKGEEPAVNPDSFEALFASRFPDEHKNLQRVSARRQRMG